MNGFREALCVMLEVRGKESVLHLEWRGVEGDSGQEARTRSGRDNGFERV
jgi:hypothetical protein